MALLGLWATAAHAQPMAAPTAAPVVDSASTPASATPAPAPVDCAGSNNLVLYAPVDSSGITGIRTRPADGQLAQEGNVWSAPEAAVLSDTHSWLSFDLGKPQGVLALVLQGDNNDEYVIEGSLDGTTYTPVWVAPVVSIGQGLRTRSITLPRPVTARYLRVQGRGGDNYYSVSELQAFCKLPHPFPPPLVLPPPKLGWDAIDNDVMVNIKGTLGAFAGFLLLASVLLPRIRRVGVRAAVAAGVLVATLAACGIGGLLIRFGYWPVRVDPTLFWCATSLWAAVLALGCISEARIRFVSVRALLVNGFLAATAACTGLGYAMLKGTPLPAAFKTITVAVTVPGMFYTAGALGLCTLALLALSFVRGGPKVLDTALAVIGIVSMLSWWNLGHYHFDHYIHIWEHYHYIVGAKYGPELRYARLYQCTAVADVQDGNRSRVEKRKMRRIEADNELGTTAQILRDPSICTSHFKDPKRWQQFRSDIRFFRGRFSLERWDESQQDHGYNGTPVWAVFARYLGDHVELTWDNIVRLGLIDSGFLVVMWLVALWAFGWRSTSVALVYWGANFPARFYWNGGSFLRYDWILWLVIGICLLRKKHQFLGGAALTYATLLRVFPGFVVATIVLKALAAMVRERRIFLSRAHLQFAGGCIVALALLIPASRWATGGLDAWPEFAQNSKKHLSTALTNNMGLKTVMGYDLATRAVNMRNDKLSDPFKQWKEAKEHYYKVRAPYFYAVIFLFCLMLARAADREREDWAAACLGTGLIAIGPELTCYYYGFLLTYGLLWERRKLPGILAALLAGATCFIYDSFAWNDDHFAVMSLATVVVVIAVTAHAAFGKGVPVEDPVALPLRHKLPTPLPPPAAPEAAAPETAAPETAAQEPPLPPLSADPV